MTKKQIDNYSIMITSKYFESIDDFINLEFAVKRFEGNMERFHFNPIRLDYYSRKFFTNLETLHLYDEDDVLFNDGMIFKHCIWYKLDYKTYLKQHEKGNDCKLISYTANDRNIYGLKIPINVKILDNECFIKCLSLLSINIPNTIIQIKNDCFYQCSFLTSISINQNHFIYDNRIFLINLCLQSFMIPPSLMLINQKKITQLKNNCFEIPTPILELYDNCFCCCTTLNSILIPNTVTYIGERCFCGCTALKSISMPSSLRELSNSCLNYCLSLNSIFLPTTIKKIGEHCFFNCTSLKSIEIPKSVTKIKKYCFRNCINLESIRFDPNTITEKNCFEGCWKIYKKINLTKDIKK